MLNVERYVNVSDWSCSFMYGRMDVCIHTALSLVLLR